MPVIPMRREERGQELGTLRAGNRRRVDVKRCVRMPDGVSSRDQLHAGVADEEGVRSEPTHQRDEGDRTKRHPRSDATAGRRGSPQPGDDACGRHSGWTESIVARGIVKRPPGLSWMPTGDRGETVSRRRRSVARERWHSVRGWTCVTARLDYALANQYKRTTRCRRPISSLNRVPPDAATQPAVDERGVRARRSGSFALLVQHPSSSHAVA